LNVKTVFVVGAGPAGLFATQKIARAGHSVVLFNRDIKPGGLAEYGIYPMKEKMKTGLRKQFWKILDLPNVAYLGHAPVGDRYPLPLGELKELNPAAVVFAVGAQGTKKLGLPGEDSKGIYSSKDFVFHYNLLPPFATQDFSTGKRVAIIGMGNVMVDIARWLIQDDPNRQTEEVMVIARRGPFEVKFDEKEFNYIEPHLDLKALQDELRRVKDRIADVGQDIAKVPETSFPVLARTFREPVLPRLTFRFLSGPREIHADSNGRIESLTVTDNLLVARNGGTAAKATDHTSELPFDTMIFAIGDIVDPTLGLAHDNWNYLTNPDPSEPDRAAYEVFDPEGGNVREGSYVVGWARKASEGLVGSARFDAERGAEQVLRFLEATGDRKSASLAEVVNRLARKGIRAVTRDDLICLGRAEQAQAKQRGLPSFKFGADESMLAAIEQEKTRPSKNNAAD